MDIRKLQRAIVDGLEDVKAQAIEVFNTEHLSPLFERVIVATGASNRQTRALAASVRDTVKARGLPVLSVEGEGNGEWIIVDCGAAVCHILQPAMREYYRLEELWGDKPVRMRLGAVARPLPDAVPAAGSQRRAGAAAGGSTMPAAARLSAGSAAAGAKSPAGSARPGSKMAASSARPGTKPAAKRLAAAKAQAAGHPAAGARPARQVAATHSAAGARPTRQAAAADPAAGTRSAGKATPAGKPPAAARSQPAAKPRAAPTRRSGPARQPLAAKRGGQPPRRRA